MNATGRRFHACTISCRRLMRRHVATAHHPLSSSSAFRPVPRRHKCANGDAHEQQQQQEQRKAQKNGQLLNLSGLNRKEMEQGLRDRGILVGDTQRYRVDQLYHWIYAAGERNVQNFSNLTLKMREDLTRLTRIDTCDASLERQLSSDETRKYLLQYEDHGNGAKRQAKQASNDNNSSNDNGNDNDGDDNDNNVVTRGSQKRERRVLGTGSPPVQVECVFIPETERGTMCVSSQIGCSLSCKFCHTGSQALERNLKSWEIVNQVMHAKHDLNDFVPGEKRKLTNVVFMGQGEPAYNYREVKKAISILTDPKGLNIPPRKIVVSTSGVTPILERLATELPQVQIAISLHATTNELRDEIVPINKTYPMNTLLEMLRNMTSKPVTIEYVMLKGINDSIADANRLLDLLRGINATVNLIPFNNWPNSGFESTDDEQIIVFSGHLYKRGLRAPIRWSRGNDILGACGQLRSTNRLKQSFIKRLSEQQKMRDLRQTSE